ncbi:bucentaur or craniofacial development domain-containing protein [Toxoplasma gondii ME49]|uniref:Bucentaur or craniofacial development domain-containing protein n=1 Tax=Toxoplasma gondii (strain ATCC 50611 / Me49) TaxID=508771 RepID=S8EZE7_TOXGM|nr:bucentaur or craniofacial development domain-containing protein [Toxoplasma gondii ME49]EPT27792.1 bucentaur or craniofacial development domain-containing protein [Toxoplasma gondii ME49]|eukprot:XP_002368600.1 bucentaur or craniofacial development domain-containing protein [Toxoplasma gondii ME49]
MRLKRDFRVKMASLLDMTFGSDSEEDDEDYAGSAGSSEVSGEDASDDDEQPATHAGIRKHGDSSNPSQAAASASATEAVAELREGSALEGADESEMAAGRRKPVILSSSRRKRLLRGKHKEDERRKSNAAKKAEAEARKEEAASLFAEMEKESRDALLSYNSPTPTDDFLLQFHRRCPSTGEKRNSTWQKLNHHLSIAVSALQQSPASQLGGSEPAFACSTDAPNSGEKAVSRGYLELRAAAGAGASAAVGSREATDPVGYGDQKSAEDFKEPRGHVPLPSNGVNCAEAAFSIREFKKRCRRPTDAALIKLRDEAMKSLEMTGEVIVKKVARFAGQNIEVEERMEAASEEYQKFLQKQQKTMQLGGQFAELDGIVAALDGPSAINSVQKSQADWEKFKRDKGIEAELKKGHGYLDKQSFLAETEWRQHEKNVELRRRQQLQQQAQQQPPRA